MIKVIEVSAPWCAQCKGFKPIFDSVKKELETDDIQFSEVNADDDDDFVTQFQRPGQHEPRLRHRTFRSVDQKDDAVYHLQDTLHFSAKIGVSRCIYDIDFHIAISDGRIFR